MKVNRRYVWAGGCVAIALVLILFWNPWSEPTRDLELAPARAEEAEHAGHEHDLPLPPPRVRSGDPDCATCPSELVTGEKRAPSEDKREATLECWAFLEEAAEQGNPYPDTSHLEDCNESPLLHATTAEQIQMLIDAGADINAPGQWGHTPLYRQMHKAVTQPSEESHASILTILEAGADPWLTDIRGDTPYDAARKMMGMSGMLKLQADDRLKQELAITGLTEEQLFAKNPEFAEAIEGWRSGPDIASRTLMALSDAMRKSRPELFPVENE